MAKDTSKSNPYMEEWAKVIQAKTKDELVNIIQHNSDYAPEFIDMVRLRLENYYDISMIVEEEPNKTFRADELSENQMIRMIGGKLSIGVLIIICSLLGIFILFCVGKVCDNFSYGYYWNMMWWSIMALCISSILIQLIIGKVHGIRNQNQ